MGLTYKSEQQKQLEDERPIEMKNFKISVEFTFNKKTDVEPRTDVANGEKYIDFGILTQPNNEFQTEIVSMHFDTVDFNKYSSPHTDQVSLFKKI